MVNEDEGMLKGKVLSSIFKGVHYELEVEGNETTWIIHSTKTIKSLFLQGFLFI